MLSRLVRVFGRDRRGAIAMIFGLSALPLCGAVGIAIDGVRVWLLASRLQSALDAAVLAGVRNFDVPSRDAEMRAMFFTNFRMREAGGGANDPPASWTWVNFMRATLDAQQPRIVPDNLGRQLEVHATARIPTTFARVFGVISGDPGAFTSLSVSLSARAERIDDGLEVALVLDVTGSMGANHPPSPLGSTNGNGTNIDALRLAAGDLVDILYGPRDTVPNLHVSIVPYTTTVNVGRANTHWLDQADRDTARYEPAGWLGCVEARFERGNDQNDATYAAAPFRSYFNASTVGRYRLADGRAVAGDNDWLPTFTGPHGITEQFQDVRENQNVGPNLGCPALPVLPLTASKRVLLDHIMRIRSTFRGGTMHNIGLQAGWFTLSPSWRGLWSGAPRELPRDYGQRYNRKILVLMTDGETAWFDFPGGAPGACNDTGTNPRGNPAGSPPLRPVACPSNYPAGVISTPGAPPIPNNADYTGFGRPLDYRLGALGGIPQMVTEINNRVSALCTTIKAAGITIYSITFAVTNTSVQQRFRACASRAENYFNSPTQADLRAAFRQIGSQLATLRLTR